MSNQWSDNLRKRMETHQEPSPEGLWEDIERAMKQNDSIKIPLKQNKILLWSKRIGTAAAAVLVLLFVGNYFLKENLREPISQERQDSYKPEELFPTHRNNERKLIAEEKSNKTFSPQKNEAVTVVVGTLTDSLYRKTDSDLIAKAEEHEYIKENSQSDSDKVKKEEKIHSNSKKNYHYYTNKYDLDTDLTLVRQRHKTAKWETGVYASNISSGSTKMYDGYGSLIDGETPPDIEEENPILGEELYGDMLTENKYREVYTDVKHKQPITMGVSLNYNLDEKWSLTSGVTYTILSSELRSGSDSYYYTSQQTLHNVGIPLNVNYNVWTNKKISIYLSGGGLVEKNVSGKLTTDYIIDNKFNSSQEEKIAIDQMQCSVNTSVGVQYHLSPKIGLYMEPGLSYYFKNRSEVETIYKEKPLNLNLRLGFRFSLSE